MQEHAGRLEFIPSHKQAGGDQRHGGTWRYYEADDADFLCLWDAPVTHRRLCCELRADERRGSGNIAGWPENRSMRRSSATMLSE